MAEQRRPFSFRLPWLPAGRSSIFNLNPPQPSAQKPAIRAPRSSQAPTSPTRPQPSATAQTEPQSSSPSRAQSRATSQPAASPPHAAGKSQAAPNSPSRLASLPAAETNSLPPSSPSQLQSPSEVLPSPEPGEHKSQPVSPSPVDSQSHSPSRHASPSRAETQQKEAGETSSWPQSPSKLELPPAGPAPTPGKTMSQPSSPSRVHVQSHVTSEHEPSFSPENQSQTASQSPSHLALESEGLNSSSLHLSTAHAAPQLQTTPVGTSYAQSPMERSQGTTQQNTEHPPLSSAPPSVILLHEERKAEMSEQSPQKPRPKADDEVLPQGQSPARRSSNPRLMTQQQPLEVSANGAAASKTAPTLVQKPSSPSSDAGLLHSGVSEGRKVAPDHKKELKIDGTAHKEPRKKTVSKLLAAVRGQNVQTKKHPEIEGQELTQVENQKALEEKELITSSSNRNQIKPEVSAEPKDKKTVGESHPKPNIYNAEHASPHKNIGEDFSKFVDGKSPCVVTLAGENKGASMQLRLEPTERGRPVHIYRGYKANPDESTGTTSDGEESSKGNVSEDGATKAYINSNIQSVNNSIIFHSCVVEETPGVQLALPPKMTKQKKSDHNLKELEARKSKFTTTPAQKITYEPTIRRRCLRGLLMESSDSDPDNTAKPRSHGCRYNCREKGIDIL